MKTNYDATNGERIEGPEVRAVLQAARVRYGNEKYTVRNIRTYQDPHWIAEHRITKGNAGILDDTHGI